MPTVSIIICTRNRASSLRETLLSIGRANVPQRGDVELLVVDNGSTDDTRQVVAETRLANARLRYALEPEVGQCRARNAGLAATSGDIILFTDDDVRVPPDWIEGMCRPIAGGAADAVAGGVVFPAPIAAVLSRPPFSSRRSWFASTEDLDPSEPDRMVGANMAFHRRVLRTVSGFDVELGPGALGFGDETLFAKQLRAAGFRLVGALDTAVEHHLDVDRLTPRNIMGLANKMGRSTAFGWYHWERARPRFVPAKLALCRLRQRLRRRSPDRFPDEGDVLWEWRLGLYSEFLEQSGRPTKYTNRPLTRVAEPA